MAFSFCLLFEQSLDKLTFVYFHRPYQVSFSYQASFYLLVMETIVKIPKPLFNILVNI